MADRRMISNRIIDSDAFTDIPLTSQALYFHLCMKADDDGFLNNSKKIQRIIGASENDMKILIDKHFVIPFPSGVYVIKHWKIHNYIQKDRYKPTTYTDEMKMLIVKPNRAYKLKDKSEMDTDCIQNVSEVDTNCTLRLDKNSIDKNRDSIPPSVADVDKYIKENNLLYVDAESFINYYESIGWMIGKHKMKSWKSAVSGWNSRNKAKDKNNGLITKNEALEGNKEIIDIFEDCQENYPSELCSNNDFDYFLKAITSDSFEASKEKAVRIKLKIRGLTEYNKPFREVLLC